MKKFLIAAIILTFTPAFAACPIDGETAACSIAQFQQQPMTPTYSPRSGIKEFSGTPEARLQPVRNDAPEKQLRSFGVQPGDYSYNSSCQFGVCNNTGAPQLFQKQPNK